MPILAETNVKSNGTDIKQSKKRKISEVESEEVLDKGPVSHLSPEDLEKGQFSHFDLSNETTQILKKKGIEYLFPIQASVFKQIIDGKDMVGRARTGTGKTLSFVLPIVETFRKQPIQTARGRSPRALVMAPTRELAKQVHDDFALFSKGLMSTACVYGGTPYREQERAFYAGLDVIVGTPGRLMDHLERKNLLLDKIEFVVLDEADQMLDIGFRDQMDKLLNEIHSNTQTSGRRAQTLFFSATLPEWIEKAVSSYCQKGDNVKRIDLVGTTEVQAAQNVEYLAMKADFSAWGSVLPDIISFYAPSGRVIVFTQTKAQADEFGTSSLPHAKVLHGDIQQTTREVTLNSFRKGQTKVLIATDVAARGIDIPEVELIVQLSPPKDVDTFIHRAGRTARAGNSGTCVVLYGHRDTYFLSNIESQAGIQFKRVGPPQASQLIGKAVTDTINSIEPISAELVSKLQEPVDALVKKFEGSPEKALMAALAHLTGISSSQRSLLNAQEGNKTYLLKVPQKIYRTPQALEHLASGLSYEIKSYVKEIKLLVDGSGFVFDLPSEMIPVAEQFLGEEAGYELSIPSTLPAIEVDKPAGGARGGGGYGSRAGGGRFGGGGGGSRSGYGGRNSFGGKSSAGRSSGGGGAFGAQAKRTKF